MKNCALPLCAFFLTTTLSTMANWPSWRGPSHNGAAPEATPPTEWSDTKNVKWKIALPGHGSATPVVWGDRVFILAAVGPEKKTGTQPTEASRTTPPAPQVSTNAGPDAGGPGQRRRGGGMGRGEKPTDAYKFMVICVDRKTGKTIWEKVAKETVPHEGHHQDHGFASASPITDGKVVLAYFGSRGLYCYDLEGNLKWAKEFGELRTRNSFGEGATPALSGDVIVVNWDHEGDDFITALDKNTGKELWRTPRSEETSWGTPLIVDFKGQKQVIVNATTKVRGYDLATGKELWVCGGQTGNSLPCSVADGTTVYAISGFRSAALQAIQLGRTGDLTGTDFIRWSHNKSTPYVPSPLLYDGILYLLKSNNGILSVFDAKTGKPHYQLTRLESAPNIFASPVGAAGRVYIPGQNGTTVVLKHGPAFEVLAENKLDDGFNASPALVDNELYLRGYKSLYSIAEK